MDEYNYDNIDFCINLLYDYMYKKNRETCYKFNHIYKQNVKLIDIKKDSSFDPLSVFYKASFDYEGITNDRYVFERRSENSSFSTTVEFALYPDQTQINNIHKSPLLNSAIMYILSELSTFSEGGNFLLPLMCFDIELGKIEKLNKKLYEKLQEILPKKTTILNVIITERYFKLKTVKEFIDDNINDLQSIDWKNLLFQILYGLYKANNEHKYFVHGDLTCDNIKLYLVPEDKKIYRYKVSNINFDIQNNGVLVKITNFDKSELYQFNTDKIDQSRLYEDITKFFINLYEVIEKHKKKIPDEIFEFIGLQKTKKNDIVNFDLMDILKKNNFFTEFIIKDQMSESNTPRKAESGRLSVKYPKSPDEESDEDYRLMGRNGSLYAEGTRPLNLQLGGKKKKKDKEVFVKADHEEKDDSSPIGTIGMSPSPEEVNESGLVGGNTLQDAIMSKLPKGYEGSLPDALQQVLNSFQGQSGLFGFNPAQPSFLPTVNNPAMMGLLTQPSVGNVAQLTATHPIGAQMMGMAGLPTGMPMGLSTPNMGAPMPVMPPQPTNAIGTALGIPHTGGKKKFALKG